MNILSYLILSVAVVYSFVLPTYNEVSFLMDENKKYSESLDAIKDIEDKTTELMTKMDSINPEIRKRVDTVLPNSLDFVKLIAQIDNVSLKYGIRINDISVVEKNANPNSSPEGGGGFEIMNYNSAIINFSFISTYDNFLSFADELEKSLRILDIRNLQITPTTAGVYEFDVGYETYWLPSVN